MDEFGCKGKCRVLYFQHNEITHLEQSTKMPWKFNSLTTKLEINKIPVSATSFSNIWAKRGYWHAQHGHEGHTVSTPG